MQGEWHGGECPVPESCGFDIKLVTGEIISNAKRWYCRWDYSVLKEKGPNISAYRLHFPATQPQAPGMSGEDLAAWTQFAAAALQGMLAFKATDSVTMSEWSDYAARHADALMAERSKRAGNAGC